MPADDRERASQHSVQRLTPAMRAVALVGALVTTGAGSVAVFISGNQAGTVVLLAIGALLAIMGLSGLVPLRFRIGDNEVWLAEALKDRLKEAPPEEAASLAAEVVAAAPPEIREPAYTVARHYLYEQQMLDALREILGDSGVTTQPHIAGVQLDAAVRSGTRDVGVEIRYTRAGKLATEPVQHLMEMLRRHGVTQVRDWLLITNSPPTSPARRLLTGLPDIRVEVVVIPEGADAVIELRAALRRLGIIPEES